MSQPILSGEQLAVTSTNGIFQVTNDPGFTSENGDGCPYRALLIVTAANDTKFGEIVPGRTNPTRRWPGFFETRTELARFTLALQPGKYLARVYAGTYFHGWGDVPDDWLEWGYDDQGKNPTGVPRLNQVEFVVAPVKAPPPDGPTFAELRAHAANDLDRAVAMVANPKRSAPRALCARLCLDMKPEQTWAVLDILT